MDYTHEIHLLSQLEKKLANDADAPVQELLMLLNKIRSIRYRLQALSNQSNTRTDITTT